MKGTYAYSLDRESFTGVYNTRAEAFQAGCQAADRLGAQAAEIYVGQRVAGDAQANLHAYELIKSMRQRARAANEGDASGDGDNDARDYLAHVTEAQAGDLDGAIEAVILRWLANYKLMPAFYRIEAISEHPVPTVTHADFGRQDREVTEIGNEDWR